VLRFRTLIEGDTVQPLTAPKLFCESQVPPALAVALSQCHWKTGDSDGDNGSPLWGRQVLGPCFYIFLTPVLRFCYLASNTSLLQLPDILLPSSQLKGSLVPS
jgi:hypothetical protein